MTWRVAKSLDILLRQINSLSPNRDKSSDGSIGNEEHSARTSDHNPDTDGVVKARDFTHDPRHGIDAGALARKLVASHDDRIKYVISNGEIASGSNQDRPAWKWRPYTGKNSHTHHFHVSVKRDAAHYDDESPWRLDVTVPPIVANARPNIEVHPLLRVGNTGEQVKRLQYLLFTKGYEVTQDGEFGAKTLKAVTAFQKKGGLIADGVVGPYTWRALEE